jgi:hypothetical protein
MIRLSDCRSQISFITRCRAAAAGNRPWRQARLKTVGGSLLATAPVQPTHLHCLIDRYRQQAGSHSQKCASASWELAATIKMRPGLVGAGCHNQNAPRPRGSWLPQSKCAPASWELACLRSGAQRQQNQAVRSVRLTTVNPIAGKLTPTYSAARSAPAGFTDPEGSS